MHEHVERVVADAPPMTAEQIEKIRRLLNTRTPDHELMRWWRRLYCGHLIETRAHYTYAAPGSPTSCPECGLKPVSVVAFEPIGRVAEPPDRGESAPLATTQRSSARSAEQIRISELEQEVNSLRALLAEHDAANGS